jgi:hypothetical protein
LQEKLVNNHTVLSEKQSLTKKFQTTLPKEEVDIAAAKIGYAPVKYFDLRQCPTSNYVFSYDRMLSTNGDTAVYCSLTGTMITISFVVVKTTGAKNDGDLAQLIKRVIFFSTKCNVFHLIF